MNKTKKEKDIKNNYILELEVQKEDGISCIVKNAYRILSVSQDGNTYFTKKSGNIKFVFSTISHSLYMEDEKDNFLWTSSLYQGINFLHYSQIKKTIEDLKAKIITNKFDKIKKERKYLVATPKQIKELKSILKQFNSFGLAETVKAKTEIIQIENDIKGYQIRLELINSEVRKINSEIGLLENKKKQLLNFLESQECLKEE